MQQNSNRPTPGQLVKSRNTLRLFLVLQAEPAPLYTEWDVKVCVLDPFGVVRVWLLLYEEWDQSMEPLHVNSG